MPNKNTTEDTAQCDRCGRPVADGAHACTPCVSQTRINLESIAEDCADLETTLTRQDRVTAPSVGHSTETPLPVNLHASDVAHRLRNTLTTWARLVADERGADIDDTTTAGLARWLCERVGWIAHQPWGPEAFDDIGRCAVDLARAIDTPPPMIALGTCDADGCTGELRAHQEAPWTHCPACGASYDVARRRDRLLARADHRRFGAAAIARILTALSDLDAHGVPVVRDAKWVYNRVQRRQLLPVDTDERGRPRYRLGEARHLHDQDIQQAIAKAARQAEHDTAA